MSSTTIYAGPPPATLRNWDSVAPPTWGFEFIYAFYADYYNPWGDPIELLYLGKAVQVSRRVKRHREKKPWWPRVDHVKIAWVKVDPHYGGCTIRTCAALRIEKLMIEGLLPTTNLAGPPTLPARRAVSA